LKVSRDLSPTFFAPLLFDCRIIVVAHVMVTLAARRER
jgi:hypothetical protein